MQTAPRRDNYISFGFAVYDRIPSAELGTCFGKIPFTWGIVDRRNTLQPSEIWADGNIIQKAETFQQGDELSMIFDAQNSIGSCKLFINKKLIYTFGPLDSDLLYVYGCTVCPDHQITIIERELTQIEVNQSEEGEETTLLHTEIIEKETIQQQLLSPLSQQQQPPVPDLFPKSLKLLDQSNSKKPRPENICIVKAPAAAVSNEAESKYCCICLENPKCVVLLPCKHLCVCEACGEVDGDSATSPVMILKCCPICRQNIKQRYKVFM